MGAAFLSLSAAAQNGQGTQPAKENRGAETRKDVEFEVLSLRPMPGALDRGAPSMGNVNPAPNGFVSTLSVWQMIQIAYVSPSTANWSGEEVLNCPDWSGQFYEIDARVSKADYDAWQRQSRQHELLRSAMRSALKERCKLAIHAQPAKRPTFELSVGKRGPRLKAAVPGAAPPGSRKLATGGLLVQEVVGNIQVKHFYGATMEDLIGFLNILTHGIPIRDRTNLTGRYDFTLQGVYQPEDAVHSYPIDQLGLAIKPGTESRPIFVIDHIEKPSAN